MQTKMYAVYDQNGNRLLHTHNFLKARNYARVHRLREESDKGAKKPDPIAAQKAAAELGIHSVVNKGEITGKHLHQKLRKKFEERPAAQDVLAVVRDTIRAEKRTEHTVPYANLRLSDKLELYQKGSSHKYPMERSALHHLYDMGNPLFRQFKTASSYQTDAGIAAWVNTMMEKKENQSMFDGKKVKIGFRSQDNRTSVYRITSERYASWGADSVLDTMIDICRQTQGAKGEVSYNPHTTLVDANICWHADHEVRHGEIFKMGWNLRTGDKKNKGIWGWTTGERTKCSNRILVDVMTGNREGIPHTGNVDKVKERFQKDIFNKDNFMTFLDCWGKVIEMPITKHLVWG